MGRTDRGKTLWEEAWEELAPGDLPGDLEDIARSRGMQAARRIVEVAGGGNLSIPRSSMGNHMRALARHIPSDLLTHLRDDWHASMPYIPSRSTIIRIYRDQRLLREFDGTNEFALAQRWALSVVRVRQLIREQMQAAQTQLELSDE